MMKRIFVAIDISEEARFITKNYLDNLRNSFTDLRVGWEKAEKLHITLKFLGDIEEKQLIKLNEAIKIIAQKINKFSISINKTGVFPNAKKARVLWLGLKDESDNLMIMHQLLETELISLGFAKEEKKFTPHLTIARIREPNKAEKLVEKHLSNNFEPIKFQVSEIVIYESILAPTGSTYQKIKTIELKN